MAPGSWPRGCLSLLGQQEGCFLAPSVGGWRGEGNMSGQQPLDNDSWIISIWGILAGPAFRPGDTALFLSPVWEWGFLWVVQEGSGQAL